MSAQLEIGRDTGALFSPRRVYRYALWRTWDETAGTVNFLMLNPSTADENVNDPTVERCERFARRWGAGRLVVTNIYGLRSTNPKALVGHTDPVGPANDLEIRMQATLAGLVVVAWGNHGGERARSVVHSLRLVVESFDPMCLGVNKTGHPVHPLYQPADAKLIPFPGYSA